MSSKSTIVFLILFAIVRMTIAKRGPHHPRGDFIAKRETNQQEFTEHLSHNQQPAHLQEDLTWLGGHHKDISEMTDDEKSFYYFKIHDTDNNDNLDGLEMVKAAIHRHGNFELQDELMHVTNVVDEFLDFADLNNDGFLNYAEYIKAMNSSHDDNSEGNSDSVSS